MQAWKQLVIGKWAFGVGKAAGVITYQEDGRYSEILENPILRQRPGVWTLSRLGRDEILLTRETTDCPEGTVQRLRVNELDSVKLVVAYSSRPVMELHRVR